ncbi:ABC transporter permease [Streptomyces sp. NPDC050448]|uniref:ABC transporter permease n=1 Tax=Streptomyces sp. NPDC050448 TaxID=3155404 RepID=UPI0034252ADB
MTTAPTAPTAPDRPAAGRRSRGPRTSRTAALAVLKVETRLFRREPAGLFWIMVFPTVLLVVIGNIPGFDEPAEDLHGIVFVDAYVPIAVLLSLVMAGLQAMPPVITGYRERGILRRMSLTPVRPGAVLGTQMGLHGAAAAVSALLSITVGRLAFGVALPRQFPGYLVALALAVLSALACGALVSALSPTSKVANAAGAGLFFPMMFSAGLWLPVQAMPDTLARIAGLLPFGAAAQALNEAAAGNWPGWGHLGVLAVWSVLLTGAASRWFRWE